jgi:hypothetical protein
VEPPLRALFGTEALTPDASGSCRYFDADDQLCRIHRDHGSGMLPSSCFHFPRRALTDERGTLVTLSHFCPTAAQLLFLEDESMTIVENPPAFPAAREYDGLDARDDWAPLVRADLLFDLSTYARWERFLVESFAQPGITTRQSLVRIAVAAEKIRSWTVANGSFADWAEAVLTGLTSANESCADSRRVEATHSLPKCYEPYMALEGFHHVIASIPAELRRTDLPDGVQAAERELVAPLWERFSTPVRRYLAAKAFGSWSAYQSRGVRTLVAELFVCELVVRIEAARACLAANSRLNRDLLVEAIRAADLLLMHLVDRTTFMKWTGQVEQTWHRRRPGQARIV